MVLMSLPVHKQESKKQDKRKLTVAAVCTCLFIFSLFNILNIDLSKYAGSEKAEQAQFRRSLSLDLGQGECEWADPTDVPQDADVFSTLLTAFPGSGKRTAFMQLEGLTELRTGDDYNLSTPNKASMKYAFMKTNYPHHEGIWSFESKMSQSIMLVRNPRSALPSYQHLLYEIGFSTGWTESFERRFNVYTKRPPIDDWIKWRELRFDIEIKKWGWFMDYWMEGGLLRDMFTNEYTTSEHFVRLTQPVMYTQAELIAEQASLVDVSPEFDEHCKSDMKDCKPVAVASFEKMIDPDTGCDEVDRFVAAIEGKAGMTVIERDARECVWEELIINGKGNENTYHDRVGPSEDQYVFTLDQMGLIQAELERLRKKYSEGDWIDDSNAQSLVGYLDGYIAENEDEMKTMY